MSTISYKVIIWIRIASSGLLTYIIYFSNLGIVEGELSVVSFAVNYFSDVYFQALGGYIPLPGYTSGTTTDSRVEERRFPSLQ
jgi:hypothetical protein